MLVSDEYVIERLDVDESAVGDRGVGVVLSFRQTDDSAIRDGVDGVAVAAEDGDTYLVDYWGYLYGRLRVTREGVAELGEALLEEPNELGYWAVESESVETDDLPWWIPDSARIE